MVTAWQVGASPAGYDARLSLSNFLYDSARQLDWLTRDLDLTVLPDQGLARRIDRSSGSWAVPTLVGADDIQVQADHIVYGGLEVLWTVYTANAGTKGTAAGDFPFSHHADIVAAVIASFAQRSIVSVDPSTRQATEPAMLRGAYKGITNFGQVRDPEVPGWIVSVIDTEAVAFITDERTPQPPPGLVISPVGLVQLGLIVDETPVQFRNYDPDTRKWT